MIFKKHYSNLKRKIEDDLEIQLSLKDTFFWWQYHMRVLIWEKLMG